MTLQSANDLGRCVRGLRLDGYEHWEMARCHVPEKYRGDIELLTGIKMLPPIWFEENMYFSDRAAEIKGIGIDLCDMQSDGEPSFWHLDPVLWSSPKAAQLFGQYDADVSARTPLNKITQLKNVCMDIGNLRKALESNRSRLRLSQPNATEGQGRFSQLRFKNEILWRCCYIDAFMSRVNRSFRVGFGLSYYPFLGPDIELDIWIFQKGILSPKEAKFDPKMDILTRMYGFGLQELRYLSNSQNGCRGRELPILERFHLLQGCLGFQQTEDILEQFKYCFYAVRNCRDVRDPHRHQKFGDRKREFDIAKFLVDKVWDDVSAKPTRGLPIIKRGRYGVQGEWCTMSVLEKMSVLRYDEDLLLEYLRT
ncbi:hypothetical protein F5X99DRAFT_402531 [Biscogniauxia marginata]|nr:hypothetical protein F5X99DRAFT_402531 [Biscogniauxia marginata]